MSPAIARRARPVRADSALTEERLSGGDVPLVSIGMPAYNSARFIRQSLEALLIQDYRNIELILSDDGSDDGTPEICAAFAQADPRIVFLEGAHRGERQNFNTVLRFARGKYFMWAADHDLWDASYVSTCVAALEKDQGAVLAYARSALIDSEGRFVSELDDALGITHERPIDRYRALIWRLETCTAIYGLIRCDRLKGTGGYGPTPAPDHLVLAKLALQGTFLQLPELMHFRRDTRASETPEEQRQRQAHDLEPSHAAEWLAKKETHYYRTLRNGHLKALLHTSLPLGHKLRGVVTTMNCFHRRFGVGTKGIRAGQGDHGDGLEMGRSDIPPPVRVDVEDALRLLGVIGAGRRLLAVLPSALRARILGRLWRPR